MAYNRRPYTFDRVVRIFFTVCAIIGTLYLLNLLKGVILPFLVSCLIAYTLEPVVQWNVRLLRAKGRFFPVLLTLIEVTAVVCLALAFLIPYISTETNHMAELLQQYAAKQVNVPYMPDEIHTFLRDKLQIQDLSDIFRNPQWQEIAQQLLSSSWSFLSSGISLIMGILSWCIVFLYVIFIMLDYEKLMLSFRQLIPHTHRTKVIGVFRDVKNAMNCYFRGQALIAFLVGVLFAIGFYTINLPMGIVFGLFIGVLNLVPYLQLLSLPIAAVLCLVGSVGGDTSFWVLFWESMAVYVVVQSIQDLYLTPKIMGKAMGLNPAIILLSLSVWGCLLGFMGLIIALPLTTLVLSYYDRYVVQPYIHRNDPGAAAKTPSSPLDTPFDNLDEKLK
ncbi:MAG: AI-2E family transporter [Prevotella sp.]|nr:AI-2E family transporter [Prevotella sp.]MCM1074131.1 AI-2E family transporter [Ruminococcus sp.]